MAERVHFTGWYPSHFTSWGCRRWLSFYLPRAMNRFGNKLFWRPAKVGLSCQPLPPGRKGRIVYAEMALRVIVTEIDDHDRDCGRFGAAIRDDKNARCDFCCWRP